jgi:hypothetical protein
MKVVDLTHFLEWLINEVDETDVSYAELSNPTDREALARRYLEQSKRKVRRSMGVLEEPHLAKK